MAESIYPKVIAARMRGQMSYRMSFVLDCVTQVIAQATELVVILVLFNRITALGGFSVNEVLLMYGLAASAFGLADLTAGQLDQLPTIIRDGTFDVLLLRPLDTLPQLLVTDVPLRRLGRVFAGVATLVYALAQADVVWSPWTALLVVIAPLAGCVIFASVWVIACAVCFWLVEGRELANMVTYGSSVFTSYPITVYGPWLRRVMAFVVPGAFVAYYPALALLDRPDPLGAPAWFGWISPLVAAAIATLAVLIWRFAVRHYRGTGS